MIYILEDEDAIREMMAYTLKSTGYEVRGFANGESFRDALKRALPELILLDIMLPGDDGIEILKSLRSQGTTRRIPVIMTTAKGSEYDKISGLDAGADDYLAKPFGMMEMVSRVRAVLRRSEWQHPEAVIKIDELELNPTGHTVHADGQLIDLTLKEFDLLQLLMTHPGRVYTREILLSQVWETDYYGGTRTVDVHIQTLRAKLGFCGNLIQTIRGVGYKMEPPLK